LRYHVIELNGLLEGLDLDDVHDRDEKFLEQYGSGIVSIPRELYDGRLHKDTRPADSLTSHKDLAALSLRLLESFAVMLLIRMLRMERTEEDALLTKTVSNVLFDNLLISSYEFTFYGFIHRLVN
jgi:hypothetical protein